MSKKIEFLNIKEIPRQDSEYYYPSFEGKGYHFFSKWYANREEVFLLLNRAVFYKRKYAIRVAKFCIKFIKQNSEKFNALTEISDKTGKVYVPDFFIQECIQRLMFPIL